MKLLRGVFYRLFLLPARCWLPLPGRCWFAYDSMVCAGHRKKGRAG